MKLQDSRINQHLRQYKLQSPAADLKIYRGFSGLADATSPNDLRHDQAEILM